MAEVEERPRQTPSTDLNHGANGVIATETTTRVSSTASTPPRSKQSPTAPSTPPAPNYPEILRKLPENLRKFFVRCYCATCSVQFGTVFNAWKRVNDSYFIPRHPFVHDIAQFATAGEPRAAHTGGELEGCTIQPLSCFSCDSIFAVKCLEAPDNKSQYQGCLLFKVTRMSIFCEVTEKPVAPNVVEELQAQPDGSDRFSPVDSAGTERQPNTVESPKHYLPYDPVASVGNSEENDSNNTGDHISREASELNVEADKSNESEEDGEPEEFEEIEQTQVRERSEPAEESDVIHRLQAISVYTMETLTKQKGDIDRISGVLDNVQSEMRNVRLLIEEVRREQQTRPMPPPPPAQPEGLPIETLEIFTENMTRIGQKANEVEGLKLQIELMKQRIKRIERISSTPVPQFTGEPYPLISPSVARDEFLSGSRVNGLELSQTPALNPRTPGLPAEVNNQAIAEPFTPAGDDQGQSTRSVRRLSSKRELSAMADPTLDSARKRLRSATRQGGIPVGEAEQVRNVEAEALIQPVNGNHTLSVPDVLTPQATDVVSHSIASGEAQGQAMASPATTGRRRGGARRGRGRRRYVSDPFVRTNGEDTEWTGFDDTANADTAKADTPTIHRRSSTRGGRGSRRGGATTLNGSHTLPRIRHSLGAVEPGAVILSNGVRLTKKGLPDMRGEAVRRRHAQRKLEREQEELAARERRLAGASGIEETIAVGKPPLAPKNEPASTYTNGAEAGQGASAQQPSRHSVLMAKIFPEGFEAQRRRQHLASQLFPSPALETRRAESAAVAAASSMAREAASAITAGNLGHGRERETEGQAEQAMQAD
ncbi:hypothetical protein L228DRAFT_238222 [Xylona heveae TC161]|uniref:Uncharacterized protein n=1 Tax=Xylona heveae (strain CBS 132557 / TC161) TaxID=1328760 RepID=A0A165HLC6_XYLHT|nr:hypothetical protein L228DRAFT_238222 [Xylona heveae TC161]KZF23689.1 hypothetical protein L228DRAFT_238222 [Xylona heveae TC161]